MSTLSPLKIEVKGEQLVITIDAGAAARAMARPSASGKTQVLATTSGFTGVATPLGTVKLSLNATI